MTLKSRFVLGRLGVAAALLAAALPLSAAPPPLWAKKGSYPPRPGNDVRMLIDGEAAYVEVAAALRKAKRFIYATVSYGNEDFVPSPADGETMFDIFRSRAKDGVEVKLVVWDPMLKTADTIPDPSPRKLAGINEGPGTIQARWDKAPGYFGWYHGVNGRWRPFPLWFSSVMGCNHQKTYVMDDGEGGVVAFVGGINPVQSYWDTAAHDSLDARRVAAGQDPLKGLENTPPLHDIFYRIKGPTAGDVIANFVQRYNGASRPHKEAAQDAKAPVTPEQIAMEPNGIEAQFLRTIAPMKYKGSRIKGDKGIKEMYLNILNAAGQGAVVYVENQYFFDIVIEGAIRDAAERGAKIICLLTGKPDEGTLQGHVEGFMERIAKGAQLFPLISGHKNVAILSLGNSRPDPRDPAKTIYSETYIHSKTLAALGPDWAAMTGGSANIAFASMLFHAEANVAVADPAHVQDGVARLWAEHLRIPYETAQALARAPEAAFAFFKTRASEDNEAMAKGLPPPGRVYSWGRKFPDRKLEGIELKDVKVAESAFPEPAAGMSSAAFDLDGMRLAEVQAGGKCSLPSAVPISAAGAAPGTGANEERDAALAAAMQVREASCSNPSVDRQALWASVREELARRGFSGRFGDIQAWIFHPEDNPWLCRAIGPASLSAAFNVIYPQTGSGATHFTKEL